MALTDRVVLTVSGEHEKHWSLTRGRETFYDAERKQRRWHTWQEATEWCEANLGVSPLAHLPDGAREKAEAALKDPQQRRLF